jgi:Lambda phage tail tube protein, TTP
MGQKIRFQGSTLHVDDVTPGTPDRKVDNIKSVSGFDGEAGEIDSSDLDSTAKEVMSGLQDFGGFSVEWHPDWSDQGQSVCRSAQQNGATKTFLLTLPNGWTAEFSAIVKNAQSINGGVDQIIAGGMTLKVSGEPTITTS